VEISLAGIALGELENALWFEVLASIVSAALSGMETVSEAAGDGVGGTSSAVFTQQRSASATLQAWAMHPRGVYGSSASKISLIVPTHAWSR